MADTQPKYLSDADVGLGTPTANGSQDAASAAPKYLSEEDVGLKPAQGSFSRGAETALRQIPQTFGGALALAGDAVGSKPLQDYGLNIYNNQNDAIQRISKPSDSFTNVLNGEGNVGEFLKYGAGYTGAQALSSLATGGVGGFIGRKITEKAVTRGIEDAAAKQIAKKAAEKTILHGTEAGAAAGAYANNAMQEVGSIYPDAVAQAKQDGTLNPDGTLQQGDAARVLGAGLTAAAVDTAMEARMLKGFLGGGSAAPTLVGRAVREVPKAIGREAATEAIQSGIERWGARQSLTDQNAIQDYVDSAALGAVGGGIGGAGGSVRRAQVEQAGAPAPAPEQQPGTPQDDLRLMRDGEIPQPPAPPPPPDVNTNFTTSPGAMPDNGTAVPFTRDFDTGGLGFADPEAEARDRAANIDFNQEPFVPNWSTSPGAAGPRTADGIDVPSAPIDTSGLSLAPVAPRPSERMGLDPNQGPLTAAAALAVDSGAGTPPPAAPGGASPQAGVERFTGLSDEQLGNALHGAISENARTAIGAEMDRRRAEAEQRAAQSGLDQPQPEETSEPQTNQGEQTGAQQSEAGTAPAEGGGVAASSTEQPNGGTQDAGTPGAVEPHAQLPKLGVDPTTWWNTELNAADRAAVLSRLGYEPDDGSRMPWSEMSGKARLDIEKRVRDMQASDTASRVDEAAHQAATSPTNNTPEPTDGQIDAGNYKKGHLSGPDVQGLDITIENPKGSERSGTDKNGKRWSVTMPAHYGYVRGSKASDGEQVDVTVGPDAATAPTVYVVDQINQADGSYDEAKALFGFKTEQEALAAYRASFGPGWKVGPVTAMTVDEFKKAAESGRLRRPLSDQFVSGKLKVQPQVAAPALTPAQQKASDRVKAGRAFFFSEKKAHEFIAKNGFGATHHVEQQGRAFFVRTNPTEQTTPVNETTVQAQHQEPGQAPETATQSVVNESTAEADANKRGASIGEARTWILGKIDEALKAVPEQNEALETMALVNIAEAKKQDDRARAARSTTIVGDAKAKAKKLREEVAREYAEIGHVIFDVPGDGKFKVLNTKAALAEFRRRVAASPGFRENPNTTAKPTAPQSASKAEAIKNMLADGDVRAALEYAEDQGVAVNGAKGTFGVHREGSEFVSGAAHAKPGIVLTQQESDAVKRWIDAGGIKADDMRSSVRSAIDNDSRAGVVWEHQLRPEQRQSVIDEAGVTVNPQATWQLISATDRAKLIPALLERARSLLNTEPNRDTAHAERVKEVIAARAAGKMPIPEWVKLPADIRWDASSAQERATMRGRSGFPTVPGQNIDAMEWSQLPEEAQQAIAKNNTPRITRTPDERAALLRLFKDAQAQLPPGFSVTTDVDHTLSLMENGRHAVNGLPLTKAGFDEAVRIAKVRYAEAQSKRIGALASMRNVIEALRQRVQQRAIEAESKRASREIQRDLYIELVAPETGMAGKSQQEIMAAITARLTDRGATTSMNVIQVGRLARAIHKYLQANAADTKKQAARDPSAKEAAIRSAIDTAYASAPDAAGSAAFTAGFEHALAGKTKSTLTGENMADRALGYEAARKWVKTDDGKQWFDGASRSKLKNTGVDLRRFWEQLRNQANAEKSDTDKAWAAIDASTTRAKLFAPLMPEDSTPGWKLYVTHLRNAVTPFKEWLNSLDWNGTGGWRSRHNKGSVTAQNIRYILNGERWPGDLDAEDLGRWASEPEYRIQWLQGKAEEYRLMVQKATAFLEGKSSVEEASRAFVDKHILASRQAVALDPKEAWRLSSVSFNDETRDTITGRNGIFDWSGASKFADMSYGSRETQALIKNEATAALPTRATALTNPKLDRVTVEGGTDWRHGKDVTPEKFKHDLGFADVGFGNWVGARNDQDHLNYAYDAFMDLAQHFKIDPKMVGLGNLYFTIGALGHGKASAHYGHGQPAPNGRPVNVINVTNTRGDGTVYHEWGHAFDFNAGGDWPRVRHIVLELLTYEAPTAGYWRSVAQRFLVHGAYWRGDKDMDVVDAAVRGINHYTNASRRTNTTYKENADKLGEDYWGNERELWARVVEAWSSDTLGHTNTYLVNPDWVGEGKASPANNYRGTPYPTGDERALFNGIVDAVRAATSEKDGKLVVSEKVFRENLPDEIKEGIAEHDRLQKRENMATYYEELMAAQAEEEAQAKEKAAREKAEEDALAAEALASLNAPTLDGPKPDEAQGPLSDDDLSAIFDQAAAELQEEQSNEMDVPAPSATTRTNRPRIGHDSHESTTTRTNTPATPQATDKTAGALIAEAAKMGVKGIDESLKALAFMFGAGPGKLQSFPAGFDQEAYAKAKPHFQKALDAFQEAGKSLKDLFKLLIQQLGAGVKPYAIQFAKDNGLGAQLGRAPDAGEVKSPSMKVADYVMGKLANHEKFTWQDLFAQGDEAFGGTQAEGKYTPKDAYDAMEAGLNRYVAANFGAFNPNAPADEAAAITQRLNEITQLLPTQTKRTAEQDEFQQFSTVPPLAYVANWVANVQSSDTYMEPEAGVGGLAAFAKGTGARIVLNELSSRRAAVLQDVFPTSKVYHENAEQLNNIIPDTDAPTVVVMNPPFSATAGRIHGKRDTQIGAMHIEQALKRLVDGGRLVAVSGEGMGLDKPAFRAWWGRIQKEYDVKAVIPMDGSGYAKYGTTFNNVLIVIDKVKPTGQSVITTPVKQYTALIDLLKGVRDARPDASKPSSTADEIERNDSEQASADAAEAGEGADRPGQPGVNTGGSVGSGSSRSGSGVGATRSGRGSSGGRSGTRGAGSKPGDSGRAPSANPEGSGNGTVSVPGGLLSNKSGVTVESKTDTTPKGELTDEIFADYTPQRLKIPGARPHPGALVESAAMSAVQPPAPTYTPNLPREMITDGKTSIAQLEPVVYAGQAHSEMLPEVVQDDGKTKVAYRRGYFVGDGTGVGKGREISAIIMDNLRQGRKKAVWISEKQGLMNDAKRDFGDIGGDDSIIFNQNKTKAADSIGAKDGVIFTTYSTLRSGSQATADRDRPGDARRREADQNHAAAIVAALRPGDQVVISFGFHGQWSIQDHIARVDRVDPPTPKRIPFFDVTIADGPERGKRIMGIGAQNLETAILHGYKPQYVAAAAGAKAQAQEQSRLDQLVTWLGKDFDGVIVFDEAHNAGNAIEMRGKRGKVPPSAQALAVVELQHRLPNARVVYSSATGATQVSNLAYATRLGLWGPGTAFSSVREFISDMEVGGLSAMELVARDMKQLGVYLARSLSYKGVTYSRLEHKLTPLQHDIYNKLAEAWQVTLRSINEALAATGADKNARAKGAAMSAYWGTQQRFFNQIMTSMQMPTTLAQMHADLDAGKSAVLQLVNTNAAQTERAIAKRVAEADGESADLEELDLTPRDQLLSMVAASFPVQQYVEIEDENGNKRMVPAQDSKGNPVLNKDMVKQRDALLKDLTSITVPDGPLEQVLNEFGVDAVAEITGRKRRVVLKPDKDGHLRKQEEKRSAAAVRADADAFQDGKKRILIFSDAGGTGFSFQSDLRKKNQQKRMHYLVQPGWRADKAVQGFGRTHRSNEASQPHYYLASTDIPAQKRFLSAIARRLDQLGALTKGQRDTASQGMFDATDNLESEYAAQAVAQLYQDAQNGALSGIGFQELLEQTGMESIVDPETGRIGEGKMPSTQRFLNRMLSLNLDMQDKVFDAFLQRLEEKVSVAKERGEFDEGMQTLRGMSSRVTEDDLVRTDPHTGAETHLLNIELTKATKFNDFPERVKDAEYAVNKKSGRVYVVQKIGNATLKDGSIVARFRLFGTRGQQFRNADDMYDARGVLLFTKTDKDGARNLWEQENAARPKTFTENVHMVVGAMLPLWDRLKTSGVIKVARTQTTDGRQLLGMVVPAKDLADVKKRLQVASSASKLSPTEIMARVLKGDTAELVDGTRIMRARVSNDLRVEMVMRRTPSVVEDRQLTGAGVIKERIGWQERYFIPTGAEGVPILEKLLVDHPIMEFEGDTNNATKAGADDESEKFSRKQGTGSSAPAELAAVRSESTDATVRLSQKLREFGKVRGENQTPRFHELRTDALPDAIRGAIRAFEQATGTTIHVVRNLKPEIEDFNGLTFGRNQIYVNEAAENPITTVAAHEFTHNLKRTNPALYQQLEDEVRRQGRVQAFQENLATKTHGEQVTTDLAAEELTGNAVGDALTDPEFLQRMAAKNPTGFRALAQRIVEYLRTLAGKIRNLGSAEYLTDVDAFRDKLADVLDAYAKATLPQRHQAAFWQATFARAWGEQPTPPTPPGGGALRFSRKMGEGTAHISDFVDLKKAAQDTMAAHFNVPGKLSWWHKTIGTMRNLAERSPEFKRVFDSAQQQTDDVATFAIDAADVAPTILPRIESLRDWRKQPITKADNDAVAAPLFQGTLEWARDPGGKPERVTNPLAAGIRWTDAELRGMFGLTDVQVDLYHEARGAIDRSIDMTARADMMRALGLKYAGLRGMVMDAPTLDDAARVIKSVLDEAAASDPNGDLAPLMAAVDSRLAKANELTAKGYAPLSRFGHYTVDAVDADGKRLYFSLFESPAAAKRMADALRAEYPGATVTQGTMDTQLFKLFGGITPESLELFGNMLGLDADATRVQDRVFQEYLQLTKNNHSALKRLMHRKGVAGYSEDVGRVLASFIYANARQSAAGMNAGAIDQAITDIPQQQGELRDAAIELRNYLRDPQEEGHIVRSMLFAQYLGGSVASGLVNALQPFQVTLPYLTQFGGMRQAASQLVGAMRDMARVNHNYEKDLATALKVAENDGTVAPAEIHQLMAQSRGTGGALLVGDGSKLGAVRSHAHNALEKLKLAWGQPFALAETFNRRSTFIAAYRIAKAQGMADPGEFARKAVLDTQFLYTKANRAKWARGAIGSTLFTFKSYSVNMLELANRMWNAGEPGSAERAAGRRAVAWMAVGLLLAGGLGGLPFAGNLEDLIDGLGELMGFNVSTKRWREQAINNIVGNEMGSFLNSGVSGLPGVPIDVSGRLGMGNLIPGTGLFLTKSDHTNDILQLAGPAGDLVFRAGNAVRTLVGGALTGDVSAIPRAALAIAPTAVTNAVKAADMANTGMYRDQRGYKVVSTNLDEAIGKAIGFQPSSVAAVQNANSYMMRSRSFFQQKHAAIMATWADGLFRKDANAVQAARDQLADWNRKNPDQPMTVRMPDVWKRVRQMGMDRSDRIAATSPKALRQQMRQAAMQVQ